MNHHTHSPEDDLILIDDLDDAELRDAPEYPVVDRHSKALRFDAHLLTHVQGIPDEEQSPAAFDLATETVAAETYLRNELQVDGVVWSADGEGADDELARFAERLEQIEGHGDSYRTAPKLRVTRWNRLMRDQGGVTVSPASEVH